jgi:hypothetical protein
MVEGNRTMMKGAKTWEEMRAELSPEIQRQLDHVAAQKAEAHRVKRAPETVGKDTKPAA